MPQWKIRSESTCFDGGIIVRDAIMSMYGREYVLDDTNKSVHGQFRVTVEEAEAKRKRSAPCQSVYPVWYHLQDWGMIQFEKI